MTGQRAEDEVRVVLQEAGAARRDLGRQALAAARLQALEQAAQNHPYIAQVNDTLRVSWWPEHRYASGQPPRPAGFIYHKRTRHGGHYLIRITRDEALTLLQEVGAA